MRSCHLLLSDPFTQESIFCNVLEQTLNFNIISTSDLFRSALSPPNTNLAKTINGYLDKGEIVPNELTIQLFMNNVSSHDKSVIIKGFPKTKEQYLILKLSLANLNISITKVWHLKNININAAIAKFDTKKYDISIESLTNKIEEKIQMTQFTGNAISEFQKLTVIEIDYEIKNWSREDMLEVINE